MHPQQQAAVDAGRRALAETIERMAPAEAVLTTIGVAAVTLFTDFITAADAAGEILGLVNAVLAPAGLEVVRRG